MTIYITIVRDEDGTEVGHPFIGHLTQESAENQAEGLRRTFNRKGTISERWTVEVDSMTVIEYTYPAPKEEEA